MRRNNRILVVAVAAGALVLAGSAAFTNTLVDSRPANTVAGAYGALNVSNATVLAISYTLDGNDPASVTIVHFTTVGDTSGTTVDENESAGVRLSCAALHYPGRLRGQRPRESKEEPPPTRNENT